MQAPSFEEAVGQILTRDNRYPRDAYAFVREALDHTQKMLSKNPKKREARHVSPQELLGGIRDYALQQFGPMTLSVLEEWGVRRCEDFGEMVFNMVDVKLLAKTDQDTREDFKTGYDFHEAFRKPFLPTRQCPAPMAESKQG